MLWDCIHAIRGRNRTRSRMDESLTQSDSRGANACRSFPRKGSDFMSLRAGSRGLAKKERIDVAYLLFSRFQGRCSVSCHSSGHSNQRGPGRSFHALRRRFGPGPAERRRTQGGVQRRLQERMLRCSTRRRSHHGLPAAKLRQAVARLPTGVEGCKSGTEIPFRRPIATKNRSPCQAAAAAAAGGFLELRRTTRGSGAGAAAEKMRDGRHPPADSSVLAAGTPVHAGPAVFFEPNACSRLAILY